MINPFKSKKGLGRGLSSLIGDNEISDSKTLISISSIIRNKYQPRKNFEKDSLEELTNSIRARGIIQPIIVRKSDDHNDKFEIVAGERRWQAAQNAGLHEVPVVVIKADNLKSLEFAIVENVQRKDLNPIEEAEGYKKLIDDFGYDQDKVSKFIEKPKLSKAKQIVKNKGYWNSGIFYIRKDSIINNFKKYQNKTYKNCLDSVVKSKYRNSTYYLNKRSFVKSIEKSFDYAILEKAKKINAIKLDIPWSDLGSWREISKVYKKNKAKYYKKKNVYYRPWGRYVNLFEGKNFLVKELTVNSKSSISLQKHTFRSEHWMITHGKPFITINKKRFYKKPDESVFIPIGAIHRIENHYKKPVKIIEVQTGPILKETDIIRFKDIYGRVN